MNARDKLNSALAWGCVAAATLLGLTLQSWWAFWGTLAATIGGCCYAGGIRTHPDARPSDDGRGRRDRRRTSHRRRTRRVTRP